jgi:hypothetical protein
MQANPPGGLRGFFVSKPGRIVFVLIAVALVFGTFAYVATILAIPVFILVGLVVPILLGLKRPRFLAVAGLVVLLVVAPLASIVFTQELLVAPAAASSPGLGPFEKGGSVLQNATISPFSGSSSTTYTWNVTLYPKYLGPSLNSTNWSNDSLKLFVSTCPGAVSLNASYCSSGYDLIVLKHSFTAATAPPNGTVVTFHEQIASDGIWSWQMELVIQNLTNATNPSLIALVGDATYNGLEGPIVGGFSTAYVALIGTIYEIDLIYLGLPFYFVLLLYMMFKSREARRKEAIRRAVRQMASSQAGPAAGTPSGPTGPSASGSAASTSSAPPAVPASSELTCPSCGAVVYAKEAKCWKCGATLGGGAASPLPSTR